MTPTDEVPEQETCKGDFTVEQKKGTIDHISTLAYVCSLMHSHKHLMDVFMVDSAMSLARKCLKAANRLADSLEVD